MKTYVHLIGMFDIRVKIVVKHTVALILDRQIMVYIRIGINSHTRKSIALLGKFGIEKTAVLFKSILDLEKAFSFAEGELKVGV